MEFSKPSVSMNVNLIVFCHNYLRSETTLENEVVCEYCELSLTSYGFAPLHIEQDVIYNTIY